MNFSGTTKRGVKLRCITFLELGRKVESGVAVVLLWHKRVTVNVTVVGLISTRNSELLFIYIFISSLW